MMEAIFIKIINMSITASWLILAVILLRGLFKGAPKWIRGVLWVFVGIRLICPFSFESELSWLLNVEPISLSTFGAEDHSFTEDVGLTVDSAQIENEGQADNSPTINAIGQEGNEALINKAVQDGNSNIESYLLNEAASTDSKNGIWTFASFIWVAGIVAMGAYCVVSLIKIRKRVAVSIKIEDNIYICDYIDTPFILGVLRPRVYIPSYVSGDEMKSVIAHECAHIKRHDHWWKPLAFILLAIYWFNPLIWMAYVLLCKDIELACDERVIKNMDISEIKRYSEALLACSVSRKMILAAPLGFGEVAVKTRIKSVLSYKKPTCWIIGAAIMVSIITLIGFMTNPVSYEKDISNKLDTFVSDVILTHFEDDYTEDNFACESHRIIGVKKEDTKTIIYTWVLYQEYTYHNKVLEEYTGSSGPAVITVNENKDGRFELMEYWEPRDGAYYADDIRAKFPRSLQSEGLDSQKYIKEQSEACLSMAYKHFGIDGNNESDLMEDKNSGIEQPASDENYVGIEGDVIRYTRLDGMYWIDLSKNNNQCYLCIPYFSVRGYTGTYELTDTSLVLTFYYEELGGEITRVFKCDGDKLTYDMEMSKIPDVVNMTLKDGDIFLIHDSDMFEEEIAKAIGYGIMGYSEQQLKFVSEDYLSENEEFYDGPSLYLNQLNKTFSYSSAVYSSYIIYGSYDYTDGRLILKADEDAGGETYVFKKDGEKFVYVLEDSILNYEPPYSSTISSPFIQGETFILGEAY